MQELDGLFAVLAIDVGGDVIHRSRPIQGHHGDDVLEAIGLEPFEAIAHARAFELEDAHRIGAGQQLVAGLVIERQRRKIDIDAAPALHQINGLAQYRQGLETQEVELDEACGLHQLPVELRDREARLGVAIERHQLFERTVADHHACRVRRSVPVKPLELLRDFEQPSGDRLALALLGQFGLDLDGLGQGYRIGRIVGDQLAKPIDLPVGHLQHPAHITQHGTRLQLAVGDDLGHAVGTILALHVADHLVASILAKVDVEIRHRHALGVQEALKQEAKTQGIKVGNGQRPGDHGTCPRAAAWAHRDAVGLGPFDEVGNDQEVAGIFHPRDHIDLEGQPVVVVLRREPGCQRADGEALAQAGFGLGAQLIGFELELLGLGSAFGGDDKLRQNRLAAQRPKRTPLGDLDGVGQRFRQVPEQLRHLLGAFEEVLAREPAAVVLRHIATLGDAQQRIMRLMIVGAGEIHFIAGDDRQQATIGELEQAGLGLDLVRQSVTLELDIEPVAEDLLQGLQARQCQLFLVLSERLVDGTVRAAGQRNQTVDLRAGKLA